MGRARTALQQRELPLLLYSERLHFFRRHRLKGASHAVLYAPPTYADFYLVHRPKLEPAPRWRLAARLGAPLGVRGTHGGPGPCRVSARALVAAGAARDDGAARQRLHLRHPLLQVPAARAAASSRPLSSTRSFCPCACALTMCGHLCCAMPCHAMPCHAVLRRLDLPPLQRLVGDARASRMLSEEDTSYLFS